MLVTLVALAVSGAHPDGEIDIEELFRPTGRKKEKVAPSVCPVCGKPLWMHAEAGFVCEDPAQPAVRLRRREVTCPVCGRKFAAPLSDGRSRRGATDADFCTHPIGTAAVMSNVWLCVGCGYAARHADFEKPVEARVKKFVKDRLTKPTDSKLRGMIGLRVFRNLPLDFLRLEDVPDTLEYENAVQISSFRDAPEDALARLHLEASYACRREFCAALMCEHIFRTVRETDRMLVDLENLEPTVPERMSRVEKLIKDGPALSRDERFYLRVKLASYYVRLGEGWRAREELVKALSCADDVEKPAKTAELRKLVRDRLSLLAREAQHQSLACEYMMEAIEKGGLERKDLPTAGYLVGELHKRLGKLEEAASWFRAARALAGEKEGVGRLVEEALANPLLRGVEPGPETLAKPLRLLALEEELKRGLAEARERERQKKEEEEKLAKTQARKEADRAATSCREILGKIHHALLRYREKTGRMPSSFRDLTEAGLLAPEEANGFVCPEAKRPLFYRKLKKLSGRDFIVYHKDPVRCPCRLVLLADGTVGTVDE